MQAARPSGSFFNSTCLLSPSCAADGRFRSRGRSPPTVGSGGTHSGRAWSCRRMSLQAPTGASRNRLQWLPRSLPGAGTATGTPNPSAGASPPPTPASGCASSPRHFPIPSTRIFGREPGAITCCWEVHSPARPAAEPQCRHEPIPPAWRWFRSKRDGTVAEGLMPMLSGRDVLQTWLPRCRYPFGFAPNAGPAMSLPLPADRVADRTPRQPRGPGRGSHRVRCLNQYKESSPP